MTQASIEQEIEMEEHEIKEQEQKVAQKANEKIVANPSGISNPRYFEHARTPKKAKNAYALKKMDSFNFNF
jgi:hypothetical protein